ncbi:MAG: hypothetical protein OQJ80_08585 [Kangiella sp.]|nr:hypothetical protein [Kangiella sp.]
MVVVVFQRPGLMDNSDACAEEKERAAKAIRERENVLNIMMSL